MQLRFNGRSVDDIPGLIAAVGDAELRSPLRSTVPSIAYWRHPAERLAELARQLEIRAPENPAFHFEYAVPVQAGRGEPSMTDLMILGEDDAIAVEAKYTEPPYESVETWLGSPESGNRRAVLGGWLALLNSRTGAELGLEDVAGLAYQLVHRAASACFPQTERRCLVYLVFSDTHAAYYQKQLWQLAGLCGATPGLACFLAVVPFEASPAYAELIRKWKNGERELSDEVRQLLLSDGHFRFAEPRLERF